VAGARDESDRSHMIITTGASSRPSPRLPRRRWTRDSGRRWRDHDERQDSNQCHWLESSRLLAPSVTKRLIGEFARQPAEEREVLSLIAQGLGASSRTLPSTSGVGRRAPCGVWRPRKTPLSHHLIDPARATPAAAQPCSLPP